MPDPITDPSVLKPGDPIRIISTDGAIQDLVVGHVDGGTITAYMATGGAIPRWLAATADRPPAFLGGCASSAPKDFELDPDDLTRDQLAETDPMLSAVGEALDEWLHMHHGILSSHHNAGHFWTLLHEHGYRIVPNEPVPDFALPASTD